MRVIPTPLDCSQTCVPGGTSSTPGPQGPAGTPGTDGTNGIDAFTLSTTGTDVMPAEAGSVTIVTTTNTAFLAVGEVAFTQFWGYMQVTAKPTSTSVTLLNLRDTATGAYASNAAPGTVLPAGAFVVPGGLQGISGATDTNLFLQRALNLGDLLSAADARTNLGLGTSAVVDTGTSDGSVPLVDDAAGLTAGEVLLATADGVESRAAADVRTALGLGTIATQAASAVAITGGAIDSTPIGGSTPAAVAATTLSASGTTALAAKLFTPSTAIQSLLAATTVSPNAARIRVGGNGGAVLLVALPTITNPASDGQRLLIQGTHDTNTVTFQDEGTLPNSKLRLGANTRALGKGDQLELVWDQVDGTWYEVAFAVQV